MSTWRDALRRPDGTPLRRIVFDSLLDGIPGTWWDGEAPEGLTAALSDHALEQMYARNIRLDHTLAALARPSEPAKGGQEGVRLHAAGGLRVIAKIVEKDVTLILSVYRHRLRVGKMRGGRRSRQDLGARMDNRRAAKALRRQT